MNDWSQWTSCRLRSQLFGFFDTVLMASIFAGRLVEPCLDVTLPVFVKMTIWDDVITTRGHIDEFCLITYILEQGKKTDG
jgi:hypothetical protein